MTILYTTLIDLVLILLFLLCSYFLLKKLGLKKFFPIFLIFTLAVASFFLSPLRTGNSPEITPEHKAQIVSEQVSIAAWYTDYKKDLTQIDLLWLQYHKSLAAFTNDEISIQTLFIRLSELEKKLDACHGKYDKMLPPASLRPETENVLAEIIEKTKNSINRQNTVIKHSLGQIAANEFKAQPHETQAQALNKIMVLDSPPNLDIATEISYLQDLLIIPGEK